MKMKLGNWGIGVLVMFVFNCKIISAQDNSSLTDSAIAFIEPMQTDSVVVNKPPRKMLSDSLQKDYLNQQIEERKVNQDEWKKATKDLDYVDKRKKELEKKDNAPVALPQIPQWAVITFFAIVFAILIIVLLRAFGVNIFLNKKLKGDKEFLLENFNNEISESELERWLREALAENNFRLAVRIYYLIIIKELSDRSWITWRKEKTNHDYLRELKNSEHRNDFRNVTGIFERIWYGDRSIDDLNYKKISAQFSSFLSSIKQSS